MGDSSLKQIRLPQGFPTRTVISGPSLVRILVHYSSAVKQRGRENNGAAGYCPKILLLKRAKMVCPFHRSHREICTRNRPVSETKFLLMISGGPSLSRPFILLLNSALVFGNYLVASKGAGCKIPRCYEPNLPRVPCGAHRIPCSEQV